MHFAACMCVFPNRRELPGGSEGAWPAHLAGADRTASAWIPGLRPAHNREIDGSRWPARWSGVQVGWELCSSGETRRGQWLRVYVSMSCVVCWGVVRVCCGVAAHLIPAQGNRQADPETRRARAGWNGQVHGGGGRDAHGGILLISRDGGLDVSEWCASGGGARGRRWTCELVMCRVASQRDEPLFSLGSETLRTRGQLLGVQGEQLSDSGPGGSAGAGSGERSTVSGQPWSVRQTIGRAARRSNHVSSV